MERVDLALFARAQLQKVLPETWLDQALAAPHLAPVIGLPITALLLSSFIARHNCLPSSDFALYPSLCEDLPKNEILNSAHPLALSKFQPKRI